jgi:hypothetical protein
MIIVTLWATAAAIFDAGAAGNNMCKPPGMPFNKEKVAQQTSSST